MAKLHTDILKTRVFPEFHELWPGKFSNKTNGVTQRRWLLKCNPELSATISSAVGTDWITDLHRLEALVPHAGDAAFGERWREAKRHRKVELAQVIERQYERRGRPLRIDPDSLFDVQVKRIHEYKRQLLNALHVITLYNRLKDGGGAETVPRTVIFAGKAAPGYHMAKLIIRLINGVADVVNNDPALDGRLKVVFFPDFNVKNAHFVYPAADLSEQISTAGTEASGTGNMKFMLNGGLTVGTLDGANIEIRDEAGEENFFLFGLTTDQVDEARREGYRPASRIEGNEELREALELIAAGTFARGDRELFRPIVDNLRLSDHFLVLADYADYLRCQERVGNTWKNAHAWTRMSILNTARAGKFSSDRSIREYCDRIWNVAPVGIALD